jgi:hypothetical protein
MKKTILFFLLLALASTSCDKNYRGINKLSGNWYLKSIERNGVSEDMNILKIKLKSTYDVGDSWFGYYYEDNVTSSGLPVNIKYDLQIEISNKGKTATFFYNYGSINGWSEVYDILKLKKNALELKAVGEENYYVFER